MGLLSFAEDLLMAGSKSAIRNEIARQKCKLIDAQNRGDKEAVVKIKKRIVQLKSNLASAKNP